MSKTRRGQKERTREQLLKYEGQELRTYIRDLEHQVRELEKENVRLRRSRAGSRKELARMDLDRHSYVRDIIEEHLSAEQESIDSTKLLEKMQAKWRCHEGNCSGHLEIVGPYSKAGDPWYYRSCTDCDNRTKPQPWHQGVEGIPKSSTPEPTKIEITKKSYKNR